MVAPTEYYQGGFDQYVQDRRGVLRPLVWTGVLMVILGAICLICHKTGYGHDVRVFDEQDVAQTYQTILINVLVLLILGMLYRSDISIDKADAKKSFSSENGGRCNIQWWAYWGNQLTKYTSWVAILMPCESWVVLFGWGHVPLSDPDGLPGPLNFFFGLGALTYIFSSFWLLFTAMSRPIRVLWHDREKMIEDIEGARDAKQWDDLVRKMAELDHKIKKMWSITNAGGLWCTVTFACLLVGAMAVGNILDYYRLHGNYTHVWKDEKIQFVYFILSTGVAAVLGLVLASTGFVSPFSFAGVAGPIPLEADGKETFQGKTSCILVTAMFSTDVNDVARTERMRFTQCAQRLSLGAKLFGVAVTQTLVLRLYLQIVVASPTVWSILQAGASRHFYSANTTAA